MAIKTLSFKNLRPASPASSRAKRSNRATDTTPERLLRLYISRLGFRYAKNVSALPGKPDLVFHAARLVVFCDGDFWHGRDWPTLRTKLRHGTNARYWTGKIKGNIRRDSRVSSKLQREDWSVVRVWEGDILTDPVAVALRIGKLIESRLERAAKGAA